MKKDYFAPVSADYDGYHVIKNRSDTGVTVFKGCKVVTDYRALPRVLIRQIAAFLELYCYGEMSMPTGKEVLKVGKICNDRGGVINLFSSESRADYNRFIVNYVNTK